MRETCQVCVLLRRDIGENSGREVDGEGRGPGRGQVPVHDDNMMLMMWAHSSEHVTPFTCLQPRAAPSAVESAEVAALRGWA
eukprot:3350067-Pyramimonas_sp.AAC.1